MIARKRIDNSPQVSLLSPKLSINKASIANIFSLLKVESKAEKDIVSARVLKKSKVMLRDIFGEKAINNIFDVATGRGEWMEASLNQR